MAVQEALILLLRAALPSSGFNLLSLSVCVCACQSCLTLPPLSSPLIDSSFRLPLVCTLSASHSRLFLFHFCPLRLAVSLSAPLLVVLTSQDKVGNSSYYPENSFVLSLLVWLIVYSSSPPTSLFPGPPSPSFPLPCWGVYGELDSGSQSGGK